MHKIYKVVSTVLVISALSAFVGCNKDEAPIVNNSEKIKNLKVSNSDDDSWLNLKLYFDGSADEKKANVVKEERLIKKEELIGEIIMQELIKGPSVGSQLKPVFPKETKLLSFSIKDRIAYINLSSNVKYKMTAIREEACLRSIALSLTELKSVDKVKILIDNKSVDALGGNFNISKPFNNDDINGMKK
ncbi:GerMN domain-containing protein [Clostridium sp. JNZ J1-5]